MEVGKRHYKENKSLKLAPAARDINMHVATAVILSGQDNSIFTPKMNNCTEKFTCKDIFTHHQMALAEVQLKIPYRH